MHFCSHCIFRCKQVKRLRKQIKTSLGNTLAIQVIELLPQPHLVVSMLLLLLLLLLLLVLPVPFLRLLLVLAPLLLLLLLLLVLLLLVVVQLMRVLLLLLVFLLFYSLIVGMCPVLFQLELNTQLLGHENQVPCVCTCPDGLAIASSSYDGTIWVGVTRIQSVMTRVLLSTVNTYGRDFNIQDRVGDWIVGYFCTASNSIAVY